MATLQIDLKTNYAPREEFRFIEAVVLDVEKPGPLHGDWCLVSEDDDYTTGFGVTRIWGLQQGKKYRVVIRLLDDNGGGVGVYMSVLDLEQEETALTAVISRPYTK